MDEPVIGIDLGTTWSAVASVAEGRPFLISNRQGARLTPSLAGFTPAGGAVVGEAARMLAETHPDHVAFAAKRFIGRKWTPDMAAAAREVVPYPVVGGPDGEVRLRIAGRALPVTEISAMILGELRADAEAQWGRTVRRAVITVPANFDDGQRNATKEAARIAGLEVLRIVNEPTAAALAYGLSKNFSGRALVFDLGGGTFDVSILEVRDGVFEVRATGGDPHLGGEDFDNRIVQWLLAQLPQPGSDGVARDPVSLQRLKAAAEKAKRELTTQLEARISLPGLRAGEGGPTVELETALTRDFFETLSRPLSERCLSVCQQTLREAEVEPTSMDAVLLVGGMTRVPLVRQLVADFFGRAPASGIHPDEVVALGAAIHAHEVAGQAGRALLLDVAAHALGVGVVGGRVRRLIPKNTTIPTSVREIFYPGSTGQTRARLPIYEGESEFASEAHKLGEVVLEDLPAGARDASPIEVVFELAVDGTLGVCATELSTGKAEAIRIESAARLTPAEEARLTAEQARRAQGRAAQDAAEAPAQLERLFARGERLARLLEQGVQEDPSTADEARRAVAEVRALLDVGRAAMKAQDPAQMAEVRTSLLKLLR
jgi:molecular chaperone DnaK